MTLLYRIYRLLIRNAVHRQLYPPPAANFRIRSYEERDRLSVLALHDLNAPDRFPVSHRPVFEQFLDSPPCSFFVADVASVGVVGCGAVVAAGDHVHTLCYGLIHPAYQGRGIGSTMALARIVFATRLPGNHFSFIFAVPKSVGFYRRFGFTIKQTWKWEDGKDYPIGVLAYSSATARNVETILCERGHRIDSSLPLAQDPSKIAIVTPMSGGRCHIAFNERKPNKAPEPTPMAVTPPAAQESRQP